MRRGGNGQGCGDHHLSDSGGPVEELTPPGEFRIARSGDESARGIGENTGGRGNIGSKAERRDMAIFRGQQGQESHPRLRRRRHQNQRPAFGCRAEDLKTYDPKTIGKRPEHL